MALIYRYLLSKQQKFQQKKRNSNKKPYVTFTYQVDKDIALTYL